MYILITTTASNETVANKIVQSLLTQRLAACVQMQNIQSHYIWQGKIENSTEILLFIKTIEAKYDAVENCILQNHPYNVPQITAMPIVAGFEPYLAWIDESIT